jgi:magnesium transporter
MTATERLRSAVRRPFRRQSKPGSVPGTVRPHPEALPTRLSVIAYGPDEILEKSDLPVSELDDYVGEFPVCWINCVGLGTADVLHQLGERFGIHPLALEDAVNTHQNAKVEEYEGGLFIVVRMAHLEQRLWAEQISLFVGRDFVITLQEQPVDCFDPLRHRIRQGWGHVRNSGTDYLAYALIDAVLDHFFPILEEFGRRLDELEDEVMTGSHRHTIATIHHVRSDLMLLRRVIWPHRDAVNDMLRDEHPLVSAETRTYLRDCYDHTVQLIDVSEGYRDLCAGLRDLHFSLLSQRTNEVMRVLTIIATIFMPLSFIAGVYGMNFDTEKSRWNMPELEWAFGYPLALALMAAVAAVMLWYFWRRGWLDRSEE